MAVFHRKCSASKPRLPRLWLFTDARIADDATLAAVAALPRGSGVVFRHYDVPMPERRALYERVRAITRRRRLLLLLAGPARRARAWGADGLHISGAMRRSEGLGSARLIRTASAHKLRDVIAENRGTVDLIFLSPLFETRSHPGGRALGPLRFAALARRATMPVVALGGMNAARFRRARALGACGWAGIDALTGGG